MSISRLMVKTMDRMGFPTGPWASLGERSRGPRLGLDTGKDKRTSKWMGGFRDLEGIVQD